MSQLESEIIPSSDRFQDQSQHSIFSIAPAQDNGKLADERLFLIGG